MSTESVASKRKLSKRKLKQNISAYIFLLPWIIGFFVFITYPLIASVYYSLTDWDLLTPPKWQGLKNFYKMIHDKLFWQALKVTITYAAMRVPAGIFFGLSMALVLSSKYIKGQGSLRVLYYMPAVLPPVAVSLMWAWIFSPQDGLLNNVLAVFHIKPLLWIQDEKLVLPSFLIMAIWTLMGKNMLVYLAGLVNIPEQLVESASIDGAKQRQIFWRIKIPMLTPIIFYELIITLIESFKIFTQAYVMTEGGPRNASLFYVFYLYRNAFEFYQMGYASALAWAMFLIVLVLTLLIFKSSNKWVYYESGKR